MKKGFTLIELLAVILILGIIALIAIPTVNNILDESRRGAFKTTTQNVLKQAEETCMMENIKGIEATKTYTITDGNVFPKLDLKGELPDNGTIILDGECQGKIAVNNKYCANNIKKYLAVIMFIFISINNFNIELFNFFIIVSS